MCYTAAECLYFSLIHTVYLNMNKKKKNIQLKDFFFLKLILGLNPKDWKSPKRRKQITFLKNKKSRKDFKKLMEI